MQYVKLALSKKIKYDFYYEKMLAKSQITVIIVYKLKLSSRSNIRVSMFNIAL